MFLGAFFYLYLMDSRLALIIIVLIPFFALLSKIYVRRMRQLSRDVRDSDSRVQSILQETVQNRMLVKTLESEETMVERLDDQHRMLQSSVERRTNFRLLSNLILNFGFAFCYLIAFAWSAMRMSAGTLSFGGMTAFLQLVNKIQSPARSLMKLAPAFVSVFTAAERLMLLEETPLEEQGDDVQLGCPCGIRLENVTY
jgi:ABC-type multidrug transport system fused ATPase/permease subunit